ncbi:hypothetical protein YS9_3347 [Enterococcus sp. C1]|uniref:BspA family leucine-rich repeat surface protein n=1 Tax=Enterococcus sp. C1 TaxID=1182762 RepID=UPI0002721938|nr:BspA family leucine-rich repeat surface protein [Enterococcus sp. C1]EJF48100.1 hypothetical protein YS9_3347 [Enterococcus sp. C1]
MANTIDEETSASVEETIASDEVLSPDLSVEEPTDESINSGQETSDLNDTSTSDVSGNSSSSEEINNDSGESGELKKSSSSDETTNPKDNLTETRSTIIGTWGTAQFSFDKSSGQLTVAGGTIWNYQKKPWQQGEIDATEIKKIVFTSSLVLPPNSTQFFYSLSNLTDIDGIGFLDTSSVTDMDSMFYGLANLQTLDLGNFDTSSVTNMRYMFNNASSLQTLDLSNFDTSSVTDMVGMFAGSANLQTLNLSSFDTSSVTNMSSMFADLANLQTLDLGNFDTSSVTNMRYMFSNASSLQTLDLSNFDTTSVTDMSGMFAGSANLQTLNLSSFDTSSVTNMRYMFNNASSLQTLDLSNFNTSSVTNMSYMFAYTNLSEIDLSNFDTSSVTNMSGMFSVRTLNLSNFDTSSVTTMATMFSGASNLRTLNLSNFNTSSVTNMNTMFFKIPLSEITLGSNFRFSNHTADLPSPLAKDDSQSTGKWIKEDDSTASYTPSAFMYWYGTGELTAGTYVAELLSKVNTKITFSQEKGIIGEPLTADVIIKNMSSFDTIEDISISIVKLLDSTVKDKQNFQFDPKIKIEKYEDDRKISEETISISEQPIRIGILAKNQYYKVALSGTVWNTSMKKPEGNYEFRVDYVESANKIKRNSVIKGYYSVESGSFGFRSVPESLTFEDTALELPVKEMIINRELSSWSLTINDYRGTISLDEGGLADRRDWEIVASAEPFKSSSGKTIDPSVLRLIYKEEGKITDLSSGSQVPIFTHKVAGETPKDNNQTVLKWDDTEGIFAKVSSGTGIEADETYHSSITLDLRNTP